MITSIGAGCTPVVPPVNPGFVSVAPRRDAQVDVGVQAEGVAMCPLIEGCRGAVGGAIHVEPYATDRISVPLSVSGSGVFLESEVLAVPTRLGVRYRLGSGVAVGAGAGPSVLLVLGDSSGEPPAVLGGGNFDVDLAIGTTFSGGAVSFAARPAYSVMGTQSVETMHAFTMPLEAAAMAFMRDNLALGGSVVGGPTVTKDGMTVGAIGGTVGAVVWVDRPRTESRRRSPVGAWGR